MTKSANLEIKSDSYLISCNTEDTYCRLRVFTGKYAKELGSTAAKEIVEYYMKKDMDWVLYDFTDDDDQEGVGYTFKYESGESPLEVLVEFASLNGFLSLMELVCKEGDLDKGEEDIEITFGESIEKCFEEIKELEKREKHI